MLKKFRMVIARSAYRDEAISSFLLFSTERLLRSARKDSKKIFSAAGEIPVAQEASGAV
jgi:hypothetical protein